MKHKYVRLAEVDASNSNSNSDVRYFSLLPFGKLILREITPVKYVPERKWGLFSRLKCVSLSVAVRFK